MRTKFLQLLMVVAFALMLSGCSDSKTLLYQKEAGSTKTQQIYKCYENGDKDELLVNNGENPQWIPGTKTHFAYLERKPNSNLMKLWIADEDGKNPKALTGFDLDYYYSWSPDGKWIAVSSWGSNGLEILKVAVDGSGSVPITNNTKPDQYPAWSPDANKIAYISARPDVTDYGVYVFDMKTNKETYLTPGLDVFGYKEGRLSWSWDGKYIAFICSWGSRDEIGIVNAETGKWTQLTSPTTHPSTLGCYDLHWYDKYLFYFRGSGFYRIDMDTKKELKLGDFYASYEHSRPSANASHVFFSYTTSGKIPPHIISIQHYTAAQSDIGEGKYPAVWGATIPLIPQKK